MHVHDLSGQPESGAAALSVTSSTFRTISKSNQFLLDTDDRHYHSHHGLAVLNNRISELERTEGEEEEVEVEDLDDVISSLNGGI